MSERLKPPALERITSSRNVFFVAQGGQEQTSSPLGPIEYEKPEYARGLDRIRREKVFKLHPELAPRNLSFYTPYFKSKEQELENILPRLTSGKISLFQLALGQMRMQTIGTAFLLAWPRPPHNRYCMHRIKAYKLASAETGRNLLKPYHRFSLPHLKGYGGDKSVNIALAFTLCHPDHNQGITSLPQLIQEIKDPSGNKDYSWASKTSVHTSTLRGGFIDLLEEGKLEEVASMADLSIDKDQIYQQASYWLYQIAINTLSSKQGTVTYAPPFALGIDQERYPGSEFLPYLAYAFLRFYTELPKHIPEGEQCNIRVIASSMQRFLNFSKTILTKNPNPEVIQIIATYKNSFEQILERFRDNPNLWNRTNPRKLTPGTPYFQDILEEIRKSGGRGKAPVAWTHEARMRAQRGQI